MGDIIWLASYPKSGNTWFRVFISNLLNEEKQVVSINNIKTNGIFSSRQIIDSIIGVESSDLTSDEIDCLRPAAYNYLAQTAKGRLFIKVHDAYTYLQDGTPLLGTVNAKAVYIIRNPLDIAVSFANHTSVDINDIIRIMSNVSNASCNSKKQLPKQLRQKLLSWSAHVESWANASALPVHLMRYEDMQADPVKTFTEAVRFIGIDYSEEKIRKAIELSSFDRLKEEETQNGFLEKLCHTASFFRAGKAGDWRNHLNNVQRDQIITNQEKVMKKFGYLDSKGNPIY